MSKKPISGRLVEVYAWIGYSDDKPFVFVNENGERELCVFTNRRDAKHAFEDTRRCKIIIQESS